MPALRTPSPAPTDRRPSGPLRWLAEVSPAGRRALVAAFAGWTLDAADFVLYLLAIPAIRAEFGFDARGAGLLATVALLSSAAGGLLFGRLADRFGRARVLSLTVLVYSCASLGSATAGSVAQLVAWRTLLGLGLGGEWSAGAVLVAESVPAAHRGKAIGVDAVGLGDRLPGGGRRRGAGAARARLALALRAGRAAGAAGPLDPPPGRGAAGGARGGAARRGSARSISCGRRCSRARSPRPRSRPR